MRGTEVILRDGGTYLITEEQLEYWQMIYPDLDIRSEIGYLKEMWTAGAAPRKTAKNINKFINKWLYQQNNEEIIEGQTNIYDYI